MLCKAAFPSNVVAPMPTVSPLTKSATASPCSTPVKTAKCVNPRPRAGHPRVVRRHFVQPDVQKLSAAQRLGRAPGNRPFRVQAVHVGEQQAPDVASPGPTPTADPVGIEVRAPLHAPRRAARRAPRRPPRRPRSPLATRRDPLLRCVRIYRPVVWSRLRSAARFASIALPGMRCQRTPQ